MTPWTVLGPGGPTLRTVLAPALVLTILALAPSAAALDASARALEPSSDCAVDETTTSHESDDGTTRTYGSRTQGTTGCETRSDTAYVGASQGDVAASAGHGSRGSSQTTRDDGFVETGSSESCINPWWNATDMCRGEYDHWFTSAQERTSASGVWVDAAGESAFAGDECATSTTWDERYAGTWDHPQGSHTGTYTFEQGSASSCDTLVRAGGERIVLRSCETRTGESQRGDDVAGWEWTTTGRQACETGPAIDAGLVASRTRLVDVQSVECDFHECVEDDSRTLIVDVVLRPGGDEIGIDEDVALPTD